MKKILLIISAVAIIAAAVIHAGSKAEAIKVEEQLASWENLAEQGDTAAMHLLIKFYDENSVEYVEVAEIIDCDGEYESQEEVEKQNNENKLRAEHSEEYAKRLNYWLEKGIAINDPVALATKGMRLYYDDEENAISYLSRAAEAGNAQAALFCGSACINQGKGDDAFKYLSLAYDAGAPSAGWHLAMCYSAGIGTAPDREKAIEVMRHAALLDYPEAVSEMRRIEPDNRMWHHKADSLEIDFPDFPIIPNK